MHQGSFAFVIPEMHSRGSPRPMPRPGGSHLWGHVPACRERFFFKLLSKNSDIWHGGLPSLCKLKCCTRASLFVLKGRYLLRLSYLAPPGSTSPSLPTSKLRACVPSCHRDRVPARPSVHVRASLAACRRAPVSPRARVPMCPPTCVNKARAPWRPFLPSQEKHLHIIPRYDRKIPLSKPAEFGRFRHLNKPI